MATDTEVIEILDLLLNGGDEWQVRDAHIKLNKVKEDNAYVPPEDPTQ